MRAAAPKIGALEPLGRSLKCEVLGGILDGAPVVAKVLTHRDPVWRWYFEREARVLERLPRPIAAPALIACDLAAGVMILERREGRPLARHRKVSGPVDGAVIDAALAIAGRAGSADLDAVDSGPPPQAIRDEMRRRLLEDPTAPRAWFVEGIDRCRALGLVGETHAERLRALLGAAEIAAGHGDLLPRNILAGAGVSLPVTVIDWECAGRHLRDWDRALLWANLTPAGRARVEASVAPERIEAFRALCAFALAREVKFARSLSPSRARLEADLAAALAHLGLENR